MTNETLKCIRKMFDAERKLNEVMAETYGSVYESIGLDWEGFSDFVLDLLGIPPDNTVETCACDEANSTGKFPDWGFCRDSFMDLWIGDAKNADEFIDACLNFLQSEEYEKYKKAYDEKFGNKTNIKKIKKK